ncbi:MAG: ribonuclease III [Erysipelotrichaceae bacterium]|nr:ribonuclease III [Erysipelotrichaceae bacterium]
MTIFDFLDEHHIKHHNSKLIEQAFIHSSYVNEHKGSYHDNERLEFMGDAVLQIYSALRLYQIKPELKEGLMSTRRANLVCEKGLAKIVREFELNKFLKLGQGEEKSGGRDRDSIISDMFEAFIGAVYLDTNIKNVYKLLDILMLKHIKETDESIFDYKTKLQEYVQADSRKSIDYELIYEKGPSNKPEFKVAVKIDNLIYGYGIGTTKKQAQKNAAKNALEKLAGNDEI